MNFVTFRDSGGLIPLTNLFIFYENMYHTTSRYFALNVFSFYTTRCKIKCILQTTMMLIEAMRKSTDTLKQCQQMEQIEK